MNPDTAQSHAPVPGLVELRDGARANAAPLFAALDWHLAVPAVLAGAAAGAVYADGAAAPRSALLLAGHRAYLAGDPANAGFLSVLAAVLEHRFVPQSSESGEFVLYYGSPEWATAVEATIISRLRGYQERRRRYFTRDARADRDLAPAIPLPEGFRLAPVDPVLLDDPALANRDELIEEICSERESVEDFLARSFGIALLHGRSIAGWCLSEYNLGQPCEVGIAVDGQFRRRGLAKELGRAFAQHALGARVNDIGWHCWKDNAASCTTARALGFASVWTYPARWVRLARAGA